MSHVISFWLLHYKGTGAETKWCCANVRLPLKPLGSTVSINNLKSSGNKIWCLNTENQKIKTRKIAKL